MSDFGIGRTGGTTVIVTNTSDYSGPIEFDLSGNLYYGGTGSPSATSPPSDITSFTAAQLDAVALPLNLANGQYGSAGCQWWSRSVYVADVEARLDPTKESGACPADRIPTPRRVAHVAPERRRVPPAQRFRRCFPIDGSSAQ